MGIELLVLDTGTHQYTDFVFSYIDLLVFR